MALATLVLLLLAQTPAPATVEDPGTQAPTIMPIDKHIDLQYDDSRHSSNGTWTGGQSEQVIRMGETTFALENSLYEGKPCKLFKGTAKWFVKAPGKNKVVMFTPMLYSYAWISPEGKMLKSQTSYAGLGAPIQIEAVYHADDIDLTTTEGREIRRATMYPKFSLALFDNLFKPLMKDGIIQSEERELAFINPVSGAPQIVKTKLRSRFEGKLFFRKYEGYRFETTSPDGPLVATTLVSRHGQTLEVDLPDHQQAVAYLPVSNEEEQKWGKFKAEDWAVPASIAQPNRSRFHTMGVSVLLQKPTPLLIPIPYALAL